MKIYFQKFYLQPKNTLNRLSGIKRREGVFFFSETKEGFSFAEYFPHSEFGDDPVDVFLNKFCTENYGAFSKVKYQLTLDISDLPETPFLNHQLWRGNQEVESKIIKYKIHHHQDLQFIDIIDNVNHVRLDANGLFDSSGIREFAHLIPEKFHHKIEYIEDPTFELDWSNLPFKTAKDFFNGNSYDYLIYKPSRSIFSDTKCKTIFSGNMGHLISQYHECRELLKYGDLNIYHGIVTPNLYEEVPDIFFKEDQTDLYHFSNISFNSFLTNLQQGNWSYLCQLT